MDQVASDQGRLVEMSLDISQLRHPKETLYGSIVTGVGMVYWVPLTVISVYFVVPVFCGLAVWTVLNRACSDRRRHLSITSWLGLTGFLICAR